MDSVIVFDDRRLGSGAEGGVALVIEVVLPCLNEADALPWVLTRMRASSARVGNEAEVRV